jgi:hypothetical protein
MKTTTKSKKSKKSTKKNKAKSKNKSVKDNVLNKNTEDDVITSENIDINAIQQIIDSEYKEKLHYKIHEVIDETENIHRDEQKPEEKNIATPIVEDESIPIEVKEEAINKTLRTEYAKLLLCVVSLVSAIFLRIKRKDFLPTIMIDIIIANITLITCMSLMKIVMLSNAKKALTGNGEYIIESMKITTVDELGKTSSMEYEDTNLYVLNHYNKKTYGS